MPPAAPGAPPGAAGRRTQRPPPGCAVTASPLPPSATRARSGRLRASHRSCCAWPAPVPYAEDQVRPVTLSAQGPRLVVDVAAEVPLAQGSGVALAGVDPGIIHPFAVATGDQALLVSGRVIRAEERLHLADTKARARLSGRRHRGSRRWKRLRADPRRTAPSSRTAEPVERRPDVTGVATSWTDVAPARTGPPCSRQGVARRTPASSTGAGLGRHRPPARIRPRNRCLNGH